MQEAEIDEEKEVKEVEEEGGGNAARFSFTWQIKANVQAEKWAYYCGIRTIDITLTGSEPATVLLLYSSFPEGSRIASVGRQIRSYLIRSSAGS